MRVRVEEVGPGRLADYARVPTRFEVRSILTADVINAGLGGILLREEAVAEPYWKDYDSYEGGGPERWPRRVDVRHWGFFLALAGKGPVGGAVVAFDTPNVRMLEGRRDLAVLWDFRVHPDFRRRGIGTRLFQAAATWARERRCRQLKVETQNVNVAACRFYARQGCLLGAIDRHGYAGHPEVGHEVMLLWYLDLT